MAADNPQTKNEDLLGTETPFHWERLQLYTIQAIIQSILINCICIIILAGVGHGG